MAISSQVKESVVFKKLCEKNGIDDRDSIHPSGNQTKFVAETRGKKKNHLGSR